MKVNIGSLVFLLTLFGCGNESSPFRMVYKVKITNQDLTPSKKLSREVEGTCTTGAYVVIQHEKIEEKEKEVFCHEGKFQTEIKFKEEVPDGSQEIKVFMRDSKKSKVGNEDKSLVQIDRTPPGIKYIYPEYGGEIFADEKIVISCLGENGKVEKGALVEIENKFLLGGKISKICGENKKQSLKMNWSQDVSGFEQEIKGVIEDQAKNRSKEYFHKFRLKVRLSKIVGLETKKKIGSSFPKVDVKFSPFYKNQNLNFYSDLKCQDSLSPLLKTKNKNQKEKISLPKDGSYNIYAQVSHLGVKGDCYGPLVYTLDTKPPRVSLIDQSISEKEKIFQVNFFEPVEEIDKTDFQLLNTEILSIKKNSHSSYTVSATILKPGVASVSFKKRRVKDLAENLNEKSNSLDYLWIDLSTFKSIVVEKSIDNKRPNLIIEFEKLYVGQKLTIYDEASCSQSRFVSSTKKINQKISFDVSKEGPYKFFLQVEEGIKKSGCTGPFLFTLDKTKPVASLSHIKSDFERHQVVLNLSEKTTDVKKKFFQLKNLEIVKVDKANDKKWLLELKSLKAAESQIKMKKNTVFDLAGNGNAVSNNLKFKSESKEPLITIENINEKKERLWKDGEKIKVEGECNPGGGLIDYALEGVSSVYRTNCVSGKWAGEIELDEKNLVGDYNLVADLKSGHGNASTFKKMSFCRGMISFMVEKGSFLFGHIKGDPDTLVDYGEGSVLVKKRNINRSYEKILEDVRFKAYVCPRKVTEVVFDGSGWKNTIYGESKSIFAPEVKKFSKLKVINLTGGSKKDIVGNIEDFLSGENLNSLSINNQSISGDVNKLKEHPNLKTLRIGSNKFKGEMAFLKNLSKLINLDLSRNKFSGSVPYLGDMVDIEDFNISRNQLSGDFPSLEKNVKLKKFNISYNKFFGGLPSVSEQVLLQLFNVGGNRFTGNYPNFYENKNLWYVSIWANDIGGTIESFSHLKKLSHFNIGANKIGGFLPSLSDNKNIKSFHVQSNEFEGSFPELGDIKLIEKIDLSGNLFGGRVPDLSKNKNLYLLSLTENDFEGPLPSLESNKKLEAIDVSENRLTGSLPNFSKLPRLSRFLARDNLFDFYHEGSFSAHKKIYQFLVGGNLLTKEQSEQIIEDVYSVKEILPQSDLKEVSVDFNYNYSERTKNQIIELRKEHRWDVRTIR